VAVEEEQPPGRFGGVRGHAGILARGADAPDEHDGRAAAPLAVIRYRTILT
jgi:hypothetical protein